MKVLKIMDRIKTCSFCGIPKVVNIILRDVRSREWNKFDLFICDKCIGDIKNIDKK